MSRTLAPDWPRRFVAIAAAAVALAWATPFSQVAIIAAGASSAACSWRRRRRPRPCRKRVRSRGAPALVRLALFVALLVTVPLLRAAGGQPVALFDAFFRAGALVFGGGHVVLPLLHSSVVDPGWVSDDQFLAGYGAAQAMPGPAVHLRGLPRDGLGRPAERRPWGRRSHLVAIFLPSFLLIFGALPFWDGLRRRSDSAGRWPVQRGGRRHPPGRALHAGLDRA